MPDLQVVEWVREKYIAIAEDLDERGRRRWAGAEARSLGWGGVSTVSEATGISDRTIRTGIKELDDPNAAPSNKQRRSGGGRRSREIEQPKLIEALECVFQTKPATDSRGRLPPIPFESCHRFR